MVLFTDFTEELSCFGENFAHQYRPAVSFQHSEFPLGRHAHTAARMIEDYESFFLLTTLSFPSVLLPYKEKLRMTHSFNELTRTNTNLKMAAFNIFLTSIFLNSDDKHSVMKI